VRCKQEISIDSGERWSRVPAADALGSNTCAAALRSISGKCTRSTLVRFSSAMQVTGSGHYFLQLQLASSCQMIDSGRDCRDN